MTVKAAPPRTPRLERLTQRIDAALARKLPKTTTPPLIAEGMRYCVLSGGKRFRPLLCLGGCEAVGAPARQAVSVACALELIHTYSLVHDDLPAMDNADERRGKPSCHRTFGEANAILIGDALLTLAFEWLSDNGLPNALAILQTLGRASGTTGLIGGQALDLQHTAHSTQHTANELEGIARRKTAALITASVVSGGLAGGGNPQVLRRLQRYGENLGLTFQMIDDLHDGEGFAQVMERSALLARAEGLITDALAALEPFGARAETLRQSARWLEASAHTS